MCVCVFYWSVVFIRVPRSQDGKVEVREQFETVLFFLLVGPMGPKDRTQVGRLCGEFSLSHIPVAPDSANFCQVFLKKFLFVLK